MTPKSQLRRMVIQKPLAMAARIYELEAEVARLEHQHKNDEAANRMLLGIIEELKARNDVLNASDEL